jgi:anthranilate synthase component II
MAKCCATVKLCTAQNQQRALALSDADALRPQCAAGLKAEIRRVRGGADEGLPGRLQLTLLPAGKPIQWDPQQQLKFGLFLNETDTDQRDIDVMVLMIDNYDSFTYNLVQYLQALGEEVKVVRNDELSVAQIDALGPSAIVISPGPRTPNEAGVSVDVIRELGDRIPILGVCLGHQSIGQAYGGDVVRAGRIMHGKTSRIHHRNTGVFAGLPDAYEATRYHSLVVDRGTLPDVLEVTAWTENDDGSIEEIMGLRHREYPVQGVQFHPESILTEHGHALLKNFLRH